MVTLLKELQKYETASVNTVVVERMEKILYRSLAEKDKVIVAQRLSELEIEKRHKDEINRIREEQVRLMSQLLLLGGAKGSELSEAERTKLMAGVQEVLAKPIEQPPSPKKRAAQKYSSDSIYEE